MGFLMYKSTALAIACCLVASCAIKPVKINTGDGTQQYFLDCGDDKSGCFEKANEVCPRGYAVLDAKETQQTSANYWHAGTYTEATLHIRCK
jgi:hypothetical protein